MKTETLHANLTLIEAFHEILNNRADIGARNNYKALNETIGKYNDHMRKSFRPEYSGHSLNTSYIAHSHNSQHTFKEHVELLLLPYLFHHQTIAVKGTWRLKATNSMIYLQYFIKNANINFTLFQLPYGTEIFFSDCWKLAQVQSISQKDPRCSLSTTERF